MAFTTYDNAPYLYRKSGGGGDKEIDKLVGGTIHAEQMDETYVESSTSTIDGNTITALLPTYTCEGTTPTEIAIVSGGQTVATFDFYVEVLKSA